MKELIYSRNAVYETLRAKRRQVFSIDIAEGVQDKGKIDEILKLAQAQKIRVNRVPRPKLDKVHQNNQGSCRRSKQLSLLGCHRNPRPCQRRNAFRAHA